MAWGKSDDQTAFHPRVMALASIDDERLLNEAWGFVHRAFCWSAGTYTDGFLPESMVLALAPGRGLALVDAARKANLLGKRIARHPETGMAGWMILYEVDDLLHLRTKEEVEIDRAYRAMLADPDEFGPARLRDGDQCRYCQRVVNWKDTRGKSGMGGAMDHVVNGVGPLVVSCRRCNGIKADKTLEQAGLTLHPPPQIPYYSQRTRDLLTGHGFVVPVGRTRREVEAHLAAALEDDLARTELEVETQRTLARTTPSEETLPLARTGTAGDAAPIPSPTPTNHGPPGPGVRDQDGPGRVGSGQVGSSSVTPDRAGTRPARGNRGQRKPTRPPRNGT
jgi:hypothetical protein